MEKINIKTIKNIKRTKFLILSDIHYSNETKDLFLAKLLLKCKKSDPDAILIVGDLLNSSDVISERILSFMEELGSLYPIFINLGNHDQMIKKNKRWEKNINIDLLTSLGNINNVTLLNNESVNFFDFNISSYTVPFENYETDSSEEFFIRDYNDKMKNTLDNNKYNVLMCHSPENIIKTSNKLNNIENVDLILSGHMHGGLIPRYFDKLLRGNKGIISPEGKILPDYSRGIIKQNETIYYINRPVQTFAGSLILSKLNFIYGCQMSEISFEKVKKKK